MRIEPTLEPTGFPTMPRRPPRPERRRRRAGRWIALALLMLLLVPPLAVIALRWVPPPTTAYMLQSPVKPVRYQWVPRQRIADAARKAVVAAEDQKFFVHRGFDVEAIEQAYAHNQRSRHRRGASTISQQTAKNLFLWPGGGYFRKGLEAGLTVLIEWVWGKDRILEMYLNVAEFGPGIYGVEAAAQAFFGKRADQLSAEESARLAAVLPNPRHWSVKAPGPYVRSRSGWILGQMGYGGLAPQAEEPEPPALGEESESAPESAEPEAPIAPVAPESLPPQPVPAEPQSQAVPQPVEPPPEPSAPPPG